MQVPPVAQSARRIPSSSPYVMFTISFLPQKVATTACFIQEEWWFLVDETGIDILYTLDSASNYPAIQKLKPWLQTQDILMKWEDSYVFY